MSRLGGKIALVTGASRGIGLEIARVFAHEGAEVYLNDVDGAAAIEAALNLNADGLKVHGAKLDVTKRDEIAMVVDQIDRVHGRLDILVNNAGLNVREDFRHLSDESWEKIRATNLDSVVDCSRMAFPLLKASGLARDSAPGATLGGAASTACILNLSSIMATRHLRQLAAYSATKGAVSALSRAMAVEFAAFGIRVNYLCPGFIDTALTTRFIKNPAIAKALLDQTPLRRFGTPEDVAKAALFLVSDDAAFITGAGLSVDGGMSVGL